MTQPHSLPVQVAELRTRVDGIDSAIHELKRSDADHARQDHEEFEALQEHVRVLVQSQNELKLMLTERFVAVAEVHELQGDIKSLKAVVESLNLTKAEQKTWWVLLDKVGNSLLTILLAILTGAVAFWWGTVQHWRDQSHTRPAYSSPRGESGSPGASATTPDE